MAEPSYDITLILTPLWDVTRPWTATAHLCEYMRSLAYRVRFIDLNLQLHQRLTAERADAMAAAGLWLKSMRNRRIAQFLERLGLLGPAMTVRNALTRKRP